MLALEREEVPRLTIQYFAQLFQRAEANRAGAAGIQDRKILRRDADALGNSIQLQLALGEHHVEVHYDWHVTDLDDQILLIAQLATFVQHGWILQAATLHSVVIKRYPFIVCQ
jgi:hypothetical protein